jgi:hypothetical protein
VPYRFCLAIATAATAVATSGCGVVPGLGAPDPGQTQIVLTPVQIIGDAGEADALGTAAEVLTTRMAEAELPDPDVIVEGDTLLATVAGEVAAEIIEPLLVPGLLRFRKVIDTTPAGSGTTPVEAPDPATPPSGLDRDERRSTVEAAHGPDAVAAPEAIVDASITGEAFMPDEELLAPYGDLSGAEVAVLPIWHQYLLPTISCGQLNSRPVPSITDTDRLVVACDSDGTRRYLLDRAAVVETDIADATVELSQQSAWTVQLEFTGTGQTRWTDLTREATENERAEALEPTAVDDDGGYPGGAPIACMAAGDLGNCQVAIVRDLAVITAPQIIEVISGPASITGSFTRDEVDLLANQLASGPLPVVLELTSLEFQPDP